MLASTPLPVTGPLAAPPTNCPAAPPLDALTIPPTDGIASDVPLLGRSPVWAYSGSLPRGVVNLGQPSATSPSWPAVETFWVFGPTLHPRVTVRVSDLRSGEAAWWRVGGPSTPQVPILIMDPDVDFPGSAPLTWVVERTLLFLTHAGCYQLDVSWAGGDWQTVFAAGQLRS